jgi:hypothetical protein
MSGMARTRKLILALSVLASRAISVLWFHSYRRHEVLITDGAEFSPALSRSTGSV